MKTIFLSKTFWTFLILFVVSILNMTGIVNLELDPEASWVGITLSVIGLILRLITKEPIVWDKTKKE